MRDVYWDVVRGTAMLLVVLGHTGMPAMPYLYMFHVALFFFVAGYLFKWEHAAAPFAYLGSRLRRLWWPGVQYGVAFVLLHNVFCALGVYQAQPAGADAVGIPHAVAQVPYTGQLMLERVLLVLAFSHWEELLGAMWFLNLMLAGLGFLVGAAYLVRGQRGRAWWLLALSVPCYLAGCFLSERGVHLSQYLQTVLVLLLPLAAGCVWREVHARVPRALKAAAAVAGLFAIVFVYHRTGTWVELSLGRVIGPKWFVLATFGGFAFCLGACELALRVRPLASFLALLGRESLHVMALHFLGFRVASMVLVALWGLPHSYLAAFPVIGYPIGGASWVFYAACGLLLPLLSVRGCRWLTPRLCGLAGRAWRGLRQLPLSALATGGFFGCGLLVAFSLPPYQAPDEMLHVYRAWQISEGVLFPAVKKEGVDFYGMQIARSSFAQVPASLARPVPDTLAGLAAPWEAERLESFSRAPLAPQERLRVSVATVGGYGPLGYLPQAAGCVLARAVAAVVPGFSAGMTLALLRVCCLSFASLCLFLSLRLLPERQVFVAVFVFLPMYLAQCASASADAVVLPVLLLASAYLLSSWRQGLRPRLRWGLDVLAAVCFGALKSVYAPLLVLAVLRREGALRARLRYVCALLLAAGAVAVLWLVLSRVFAGPLPVVSPGADPGRQLAFLAGRPLAFFAAAGTALWSEGLVWLEEMVGVLGWLAVRLPGWFYPVYGALLAVAAACGPRVVRQRASVVAAAAGAAVLGLVLAAEYVAWTPVGAPAVAGVQGRYLLPVAAALGLVFGGREDVLGSPRAERLFVCAAAVLSAAVTLGTVVQFFGAGA